jgi:N utilization substance protein A
MKRQFSTEAIKTIGLFQQLTRANVVDFIEGNQELWFVVGEGQYGLAVGKKGANIARAQRLFKKTIHVIEYSPDLQKFIRSAIPVAQEIIIRDGKVLVRIRSTDRGCVIGRGGERIKIIEKFLHRLHEVKEFKVR